MKKYRKATIQTKYRKRTWDETTVPEIRLNGKWLSELGFEEGREIKIEQQNQKLVITVGE